jgi:general secretion pathway protein A
MYKNFFGFRERPFQLIPNPAYLYLSASHEEALAHLSYAISQGDGFVEIIGEVGTGKTTLCRAFLENLDENVEAAYIFNPKLNSRQLLKAISKEFGIDSQADDINDLIEALNLFLIEKKAEGKRVILLIDEAQNLSRPVLEQIRLLSNLETTTSKLLQIILVGQPELGAMLDTYELRQLGQRITLSCSLEPLNLRDTREYIQHRIRIASKRSGVKFTRAAFRSIYRYSGGYPRLINIACDRALLTAFSLNRHRISGGITRSAVRELASRGDVRRFNLYDGRKGLLFVGLLLVAFFVFIFYQPGELNITSLFRTAESKRPERAIPGQGGYPKGTPARWGSGPKRNGPDLGTPPGVKAVSDLRFFLGDMDPSSSRHVALKAGMDLWHKGSVINYSLDNMQDDWTFFRIASKQNGFLIQRVRGDFDLLRRLNLPAIMEFYLAGGLAPRYLTLNRMENGEMIFSIGEADALIKVDLREITSYWSGVAYILWKNFLNFTGTIPANAPGDSIIALKLLLTEIGVEGIEVNPFYDDRTKNAIKDIQESHGLPADGVVGPLTKMVIYNEKKSLEIPHLIN